MLIDINNLTKVKRDFVCSDSLFFYRSGIKVPFDAVLEGSVYKEDSLYFVDGKADAVLGLKCDLCLAPFQMHVGFDFHEVFSAKSSEDDEVWLLSDDEARNKTIDVSAAVTADILLNLPMRVLCSDDCKGLCPKCGHNLNDGDCGCDRVDRNPQFEVLLNLFKDEQGGD